VTKLRSQEVLCVSRMNGKTIHKLHETLINNFGNVCQRCGVLGCLKQLIIDHKDNDNSNNNLDNLQFLCRSCNYKKDSRKSIDMCVRTSPPISSTSSLSINRKKEPLFMQFVFEDLDGRKGKEVSDPTFNYLVYSGAQKLEISPVTTARYLKKMISSSGPLDKHEERFGSKETWVFYKQS